MPTIHQETALAALQTLAASPPAASGAMQALDDALREAGASTIHARKAALLSVHGSLPSPFNLMPFQDARGDHPSDWRELTGYRAVAGWLASNPAPETVAGVFTAAVQRHQVIMAD